MQPTSHRPKRQGDRSHPPSAARAEEVPDAASAAVTALVKECGPMLHAVVRRIVRNAADADDVVQDTFVSAYRHWDAFRGDAKPCTWLHSIAVRAAIRRQKRAGRRRQVAQEYARALPFLQPRLALADFETRTRAATELRADARARIDGVLVGLPEPFRSAIVLKELAGMSVLDVSKVLGVREATVKTRLHRGRLLLRAALLANRPLKAVPPADYDRAFCMDLLRAKMEALDKGVDFPVQDDLACQRCRQVLASLDVGADACRSLRCKTMPADVRAKIEAALAAERHRPKRRRTR